MRYYFRIIVIVSLLFLIYPVLIFGAEIDDPAMEFYLNKTDSALNNSTLFNDKLQYAVQIKSIYQKISYRGITADSDTANFLIEAVDGLFNVSQIVDSSGLEENIIPFDEIKFIKPWETNCRFFFFPRDTGSGDLAIGFAPADTLAKNSPEGMIIINRDNHHLERVYLHYQFVGEFEWLSKTYQFSYENETILLKSLTIQGCYYGFFQRRFFRQDLLFENYVFQ